MFSHTSICEQYSVTHLKMNSHFSSLGGWLLIVLFSLNNVMQVPLEWCSTFLILFSDRSTSHEMRHTWHSSQLSRFIKGHSFLQKSLPRLSEFCTSVHNCCLTHTVGRQPGDLLQSYELVRQLTAERVDDHPLLQQNSL